MGFDWRDTDRGWQQLKKTCLDLRHRDSYVKVGIFGDAGTANARATERREAKSGRDFRGRYIKRGTTVGSKGTSTEIDMVSLATIHEFGAPRANIPERSFIRGTYDANRDKYIQLIRQLLTGVYENKMTIEKALTVLGLTMQRDMQAYVRAGTNLAPLAPSTMEWKLARARKRMGRKEGPIKSPVPLIESGRMIGAITFQVVLSGRTVFSAIQSDGGE